MLELSIERRHRVLKLSFAGDFTVDDLDAIDGAILRFMGGEGRELDGVRCLYDLTAVTALAVPSSRFAVRAQVPPLLPFGRVVVPFAEAPPDFGSSYKRMAGVTAHQQPLVVPSLEDAYARLGIRDTPRFEPIEPGGSAALQ